MTQAERIAVAVQPVALAQAVAMRYSPGALAPGVPCGPSLAKAREKLIEALDEASPAICCCPDFRRPVRTAAPVDLLQHFVQKLIKASISLGSANCDLADAAHRVSKAKGRLISFVSELAAGMPEARQALRKGLTP